MSLEYRVLTEILKSRSMEEALSAGLVGEDFKDPEAREIYQFMYRHWHAKPTSRTVPTVALIRRNWPSFEPTARDEDEEGAFKALAFELKMKSFDSDMRGLAEYFMEAVEDDPEEALVSLKRRLDDVQYRKEGGQHLAIPGIIDGALMHYKLAKDGKIQGVPWPWSPLTEDTMGKRKGTFTVFYGRMKSMKTWVMLKCAADDFLKYHQRVLVWSREMNEEEISLRLASIWGEVDYQKLKHGQLPPRLLARAVAILEEIKAARTTATLEEDPNQRDLIVLAGPSAPKDMNGLRGAVQRYKPDVLYVDSFYHLQTERATPNQRWLYVAYLAEDIKGLAQDFEIPVVGTCQANRSGEKSLGRSLDEVADSDNIAREADLIVRIIKRRGRSLYEEDYEGDNKKHKTGVVEVTNTNKMAMRRRRRLIGEAPPPSKERKSAAEATSKEADPPRVGAEIAFILGGNRDGVLEAFTIHAVPGYNFKVINAQFSSDEIQKWVDADDKAAAKEDSKTKEEDREKAPFTPKTFKRTAEAGRVKGVKYRKGD